MHPFPSLVKVDDYPEVALDDVLRSAGDLKEDYNLEGVGFENSTTMLFCRVALVNLWRGMSTQGVSSTTSLCFQDGPENLQ